MKNTQGSDGIVIVVAVSTGSFVLFALLLLFVAVYCKLCRNSRSPRNRVLIFRREENSIWSSTLEVLRRNYPHQQPVIGTIYNQQLFEAFITAAFPCHFFFHLLQFHGISNASATVFHYVAEIVLWV